MNTGARYRGQPLLMLLALLGGWVGLRTALWESPFAQAARPTKAAAIAGRLQTRRSEAAPVEPAAAASDRHVEPTAPSSPVWSSEPIPSPHTWRKEPSRPPGGAAAHPPLPQGSASHELMLFAALAQVPIPDNLAQQLDPAPPTPAAPFHPPMRAATGRTADRWSADAWLLLRRDTTTAVTAGRGSYGQSQAGAVIRYRLALSSAFRPAAYFRASQALAGARETEGALGLAARPIPGVPASAAAELRATRAGGHTRLRPAAFVVTELPPARLPLGFTGEAYAQAGYVWGEYETAFVDGEVRAERPVARLGGAELRAGGGVWGGAQKGAERLDVGPSATLALKIADTPSRVSMDWRFRIAGDANPSSGPALTVSAGF